MNGIAHALGRGKLANVLLIGDNRQLPSTLIGNVNPVRRNGEVSLMERLSTVGWGVIDLFEQYRMHPSISRVVSSRMYRKAEGQYLYQQPS